MDQEKKYSFWSKVTFVQVVGKTYPKLKIMVLKIALFRSSEAKNLPFSDNTVWMNKSYLEKKLA